MYKSKMILTVLLAAALLALFGGCQAQNFDIPTEPSAFSQPTEPTDPSSKSTEPSNETIEPIETVCPRTIEYFKSHLIPFMTYREAIGVLGLPDNNTSNSPDWKDTVWYLEDDYILAVEFYPTADYNMDEYLATAPTGETNPDGTPLDEYYYLREWFQHQEAYRAKIFKGTKHPDNCCEVLFDYGDPWFPEE